MVAIYQRIANFVRVVKPNDVSLLTVNSEFPKFKQIIKYSTCFKCVQLIPEENRCTGSVSTFPYFGVTCNGNSRIKIKNEYDLYKAFDIIMELNGKMDSYNWKQTATRFKTYSNIYLKSPHLTETFNSLIYGAEIPDNKLKHFRQYVITYFRKMARLES